MCGVYLVVLVVRDHDEQLAGKPFGSALGHQHVVGPAAAAKIELGQLVAALRSVQVQVTERALERYRDGRVGRFAGDGVLAALH